MLSLFKKEIQYSNISLELQVPIVLISNRRGGTKIQDWQPKGQQYNAMIYPFLVKLVALAAFAWCQGERGAFNQHSVDMYAYHFPHMISAWREGFNNEDAYFGCVVQLSTYREKGVYND